MFNTTKIKTLEAQVKSLEEKVYLIETRLAAHGQKIISLSIAKIEDGKVEQKQPEVIQEKVGKPRWKKNTSPDDYHRRYTRWYYHNFYKLGKRLRTK